MRALIAGGMNMDILGTPDAPLRMRDSNPGRVETRPGGVARNIAARLREMGAEAELCAVLSRDGLCARLRADCDARGISLAHAILTDLPTPVYLALHDETGDMALAMNDMRAMAAFTPEAARALPGGFDVYIADANLSADTLAAFCEGRSPVLIDPVSEAKCARVMRALPMCEAVKPNLAEAERMTGEHGAPLCAKALLRAGVRRAFISLGPQGVYYADAHGEGLVPAAPLRAAATGAGDAMCAGIALALAQGADSRACAVSGAQTARKHLMGALIP